MSLSELREWELFPGPPLLSRRPWQLCVCIYYINVTCPTPDLTTWCSALCRFAASSTQWLIVQGSNCHLKVKVGWLEWLRMHDKHSRDRTHFRYLITASPWSTRDMRERGSLWTWSRVLNHTIFHLCHKFSVNAYLCLLVSANVWSPIVVSCGDSGRTFIGQSGVKTGLQFIRHGFSVSNMKWP